VHLRECSESYVRRLPFARPAGNTRGRAVRPSPTSVVTILAHSVCRTPPGSRPPHGNSKLPPCRRAPAPHSWSSAPWMPTPRAMPRYERTVGRAITESCSTSECRRRFERHQRADRPHRQLSVACSEAHERLNLRSQGRNHASGLERRIHGPGTLPSIQSHYARGPETSRVSEPAPLRMRSRRGLRVAT